MWPILKLLVGEAFEKEHWKILFNMLKIPKDVGLENFTFGHILNAEKIVLQKINEIKELSARA